MCGLAVIVGATVGMGQAMRARLKPGSEEIKGTCAARSANKKTTIETRTKSLVCAAS